MQPGAQRRLLYAQGNGFQTNGSETIVNVYSPPVSGPHAGDAKCVQVQFISNCRLTSFAC
jgi:hypothetical protein